MKKVGLYRITCGIYYSPKLEKQFTYQTGPVDIIINRFTCKLIGLS